MPFGIPSEDFHGGFGLPHDEDNVIDIRTKEQKRLDAIKQDDYDPYTGKYAFISPDSEVNDEEYGAAAQEVHDNLVRSLVEASGEIRKAKVLLIRALDQLYLLGYDSGFTNPAIEQLVTDIKFYLNGGRFNGT